MSNSKRVAGKLFGGALLAGALFGASQADAAMMLDLRIHGQSGKTLQVTAGQEVQLDLYAVISGAATGKFGYAFSSIKADMQGGVKGNLGDFTIADSFAGEPGNQPGVTVDSDGDGTKDLIGSTTEVAKDYIFPRYATAKSGLEHLLGSVTFKVSEVGNGNVTINAKGLPRSTQNSAVAFWFEGATPKLLSTNGQFIAGSDPVVLLAGGGPVDKPVVKFETTGTADLGVLAVQAGPRGYISGVKDLDNAKGTVQVDVVGTGPAGSAFAMLWLTGDNQVQLMADLKAEGVKFVESGALYDEMKATGSLYTKNAGRPFDWMIDVGAMGDGFFSFDFLDSGVMLDKLAVVPEPASLSLLGLGAAGLMMARRRKA